MKHLRYKIIRSDHLFHVQQQQFKFLVFLIQHSNALYRSHQLTVRFISHQFNHPIIHLAMHISNTFHPCHHSNVRLTFHFTSNKKLHLIDFIECFYFVLIVSVRSIVGSFLCLIHLSPNVLKCHTD